MATNTENPIISASVVDVNEKTIALTGDSKKLVRFFSDAKASMDVTPQNGAVINEDMYIIRNGASTGYGKTYTFNDVENNKFTFSAEDDRGNIGSAIVTPEIVEYEKLTCEFGGISIAASGNATLSCAGIYFDNTFGAVHNTLNVMCRYKEQGGAYSSWTNMSSSITSVFIARATLTGLDYEKSYIFEVKAEDKLMSVSTTSKPIMAKPTFHWGKNDFVFEVSVEAKRDIKTSQNLMLTDNSNMFGKIYFGTPALTYIENQSNGLTIKTPGNLTLDANNVYVDGYAIPKMQHGEWTPTLLSSEVSSYTMQEGWYTKMNQYVTVGFFIKAYCNSGYQNTDIQIYGLPFTPMFSAAGGGMCSGAYVAANNNFQCFVAGTGGTITLRSQACNNTSSANLSTSASGCWYPYGGGELTLSGTITYMTAT